MMITLILLLMIMLTLLMTTIILNDDEYINLRQTPYPPEISVTTSECHLIIDHFPSNTGTIKVCFLVGRQRIIISSLVLESMPIGQAPMANYRNSVHTLSC